MFNITNSVHFSAPGTNIDIANFGKSHRRPTCRVRYNSTPESRSNRQSFRGTSYESAIQLGCGAHAPRAPQRFDIRRRCALEGPFVLKSAAAAETPIATPKAGKIKGYVDNGINVFKGIPYGDDPSKRRFMAALPAKPWSGVRDCLAWGPQAKARGTAQTEHQRQSTRKTTRVAVPA